MKTFALGEKAKKNRILIDAQHPFRNTNVQSIDCAAIALAAASSHSKHL
jgi:hypothetical protein